VFFFAIFNFLQFVFCISMILRFFSILHSYSVFLIFTFLSVFRDSPGQTIFVSPFPLFKVFLT
jgi:hypothetical protein